MRPGKKSLQRSKFTSNIPSCWECGDWKSNFSSVWSDVKSQKKNKSISGSACLPLLEKEQPESKERAAGPSHGLTGVLRQNIIYAKLPLSPPPPVLNVGMHPAVGWLMEKGWCHVKQEEGWCGFSDLVSRWWYDVILWRTVSQRQDRKFVHQLADWTKSTLGWK